MARKKRKKATHCYLRKKSKGSKKKIRVCPSGRRKKHRRKGRRKSGLHRRGKKAGSWKCSGSGLYKEQAESLAGRFSAKLGKPAVATKVGGTWKVCHR